MIIYHYVLFFVRFSVGLMIEKPSIICWVDVFLLLFFAKVLIPSNPRSIRWKWDSCGEPQGNFRIRGHLNQSSASTPVGDFISGVKGSNPTCFASKTCCPSKSASRKTWSDISHNCLVPIGLFVSRMSIRILLRSCCESSPSAGNAMAQNRTENSKAVFIVCLLSV